MIEGGLLIEFGDDQAPIDLRFSLSDSDCQVLSGFLVEANKLFQSIERMGGIDARLHIEATQESGVQFHTAEPDDDQRAILLHRLRPLILQKEPYAFHIACSVISKSSTEPFLRQHIKNIRRDFRCEHFQEMMKLTHGDIVINSESGFASWLNGFEYHRDQDKANSISAQDDAIKITQLRPIFMLMAADKVKAIAALSKIAETMLASPNA